MGSFVQERSACSILHPWPLEKYILRTRNPSPAQRHYTFLAGRRPLGEGQRGFSRIASVKLGPPTWLGHSSSTYGDRLLAWPPSMPSPWPPLPTSSRPASAPRTTGWCGIVLPASQRVRLPLPPASSQSSSTLLTWHRRLPPGALRSLYEYLALGVQRYHLVSATASATILP